MTLLQMFRDGGIFMWPLLACSILGLAVILVKFVTLQMAKVRTDQLLERVKALVRAGRVEDAIELCANTHGPVASIMLTGLHLYREGQTEHADQTVTHAGRIEMAFLEKGLVVLATIANVAPLIGFLGTVAGMILAFGAIEVAGEVEATLVAGGIKVALITTAAGLVIAIPVNIAHNYFVSQIDGLVIDMRRGVQTIHDLLWTDASPVGEHPRARTERAQMAVRGKGFQKKHKATGEIPSSSLADIAFLLLIFFMVSTTFRSDDPRQVTMPEAAAQEKIPEKRKDIQHIYVERDGSVYINDSRIPMNEISDVLGPLRASQPRLVAAIRGDVDVPYGVVNDVQEELRSAGAVRVNFTTTLEREMSRRGR